MDTEDRSTWKVIQITYMEIVYINFILQNNTLTRTWLLYNLDTVKL